MPVFHSLLARPLLYPETMAEVDRRTIAAGTPGIELMERAGKAAVRVLRGRWAPRPVAVLAGPGNNGGDGWVIARLLREVGWPVAIYSDWPLEKLSGDARQACAACGFSSEPLAAADFSERPLIVDALFGAGLAREITGEPAAVMARAAESDAPVLAIDLPSGLNGRTGEALGQSLRAEVTVTFGAAKPGHLLDAGRELTGELHIADIGLDLQADDVDAHWNGP
ncbi:MAG: NAD(P)H-hydrate epimerase, partial [Pseudomonadota bacterium]